MSGHLPVMLDPSHATGKRSLVPAVSRAGVAIGYVLHDIAVLIMLVGIWVHIYLSTVGQPGTLRAMTRGVVTRAWAWTHHPAWYGDATGRDPREDYNRAAERQRERRRQSETSAPDTQAQEHEQG